MVKWPKEIGSLLLVAIKNMKIKSIYYGINTFYKSAAKQSTLYSSDGNTL